MSVYCEWKYMEKVTEDIADEPVCDSDSDLEATMSVVES